MSSRPLSQARFTIPNLITLTRILLTPLFIIFLIQGRYRKALLIFILAGISDLADGLIARWWQQKSRLGSYLDPLADKLLMSASFVTLSISHLIPSWLTVMVISRDVILGLGALILRLTDYPLTVRPSLMGQMHHHGAGHHGGPGAAGKGVAAAVRIIDRPVLSYRRAHGHLRHPIPLSGAQAGVP